MPFSWSSSRFSEACRFYRREFEHALPLEDRTSEPIVYLTLQERLGDFIGRAIRFYLRRFFNPIPLPYTKHSEEFPAPDLSFSRSRVHELVEMKDGDQHRDTATADGSISSVFGLAILRIQEFFDLNKRKITTLGHNNDRKYCSEICERYATRRGLDKKGSMVILSEKDMDEIILDVEEGHKILAGIRACRFVSELLAWPGVEEAISKAGGWKRVQSFAKMFVDCGLVEAYPDEKHFTLLCDVKGLQKMLTDDSKEFNLLEEHCENSLRQLWKRFRCGTRNRELLEKNPGIKLIQRALKSGKETCFPSLDPATTEWE